MTDLLTLALVLITGYYAWVTNRILQANQRATRAAALNAIVGTLTGDLDREHHAIVQKYGKSPDELGREPVTERYFAARDERDEVVAELRRLRSASPATLADETPAGLHRAGVSAYVATRRPHPSFRG